MSSNWNTMIGRKIADESLRSPIITNHIIDNSVNWHPPPSNFYIDLICGKTKNGCEKIVKRLVSFYNTYEGIEEAVDRKCKDYR